MALDSHRFKDVTLKNLVTKQVFYIDIQLARQYFKEQQDAPQVPARARSKGRCHSYL
jgi:hypothetical protein